MFKVSKRTAKISSKGRSYPSFLPPTFSRMQRHRPWKKYEITWKSLSTSSITPAFCFDSRTSSHIHAVHRCALLSACQTSSNRKQKSCLDLPSLERQEQVIHRENCRKYADLLALFCDFVIPLVARAQLVQHQHQVGHRICLSQAVMWPSSEDKPVLALFLGVPRDPPLGSEFIGVRVCFGVVKREPCGGYNHGALLRDVVCFGDWEVLLDEVWNHEHGGTVAESLFNYSSGVFLVNKSMNGT